jgi:hypothetical protein
MKPTTCAVEKRNPGSAEDARPGQRKHSGNEALASTRAECTAFAVVVRNDAGRERIWSRYTDRREAERVALQCRRIQLDARVVADEASEEMACRSNT